MRARLKRAACWLGHLGRPRMAVGARTLEPAGGIRTPPLADGTRTLHPARRHHGWCLLLLTPGLLAVASAEAGETLAEIDRIWQKGVYREDFSLCQEAEVEVEALGSGSREMDALLAYAWILDRGTRRLVWKMEARRARAADGDDNLIQRDRLMLPAGDYALYFSAIGGRFPIKKSIKFLDLFDIGSIAIRGGNYVRWNEYGTPRDWYAEVRLAEGVPAEAACPHPREVDLGALLRFERMLNGDYRTAALEVSAPLVVRILAVGEYTAGDHGFADGAWIMDRERCERAWEMTLVNTEHAGGAQKNRLFDEEVRLEPGRYLACYATDDSHAYDDWNSQPPYDPESWGLALIPREPVPAGVVQVTLDPPVENEIVRIDRVGDAAFHSAVFHVNRPVEVCVRALGEWDEKEDRYFDYGWIEEFYTLRKVWTMASDRGRYAAGELRNRIVESPVSLEPGDYRVCYVSDEAHSYRGGWHKHRPFDPTAWGIRVCGLGADFPADAVDLSEEAIEPRAVIRIGPVGNDARERVRFKVQEPLAVRLVALGEGQDGRMYDYGWLVEEQSGRTVWEMRYEETRAAGGAEKNRRVDRLLELPPGVYRLHYRSDDSHAFGRWNQTAPPDPHLWGVVLIEMPPKDR